MDTATASEDGERGCGGIAGTTATAIDKPEIDEIDKYRKRSASLFLSPSILLFPCC